MVDCNSKNIVTGYPKVDSAGGLIQAQDSRQKAEVIDRSALSVLQDINIQLRLMNMYLAKLTDEHIEEGDL